MMWMNEICENLPCLVFAMLPSEFFSLDQFQMVMVFLVSKQLVPMTMIKMNRCKEKRTKNIITHCNVDFFGFLLHQYTLTCSNMNYWLNRRLNQNQFHLSNQDALFDVQIKRRKIKLISR